MADKAKYNELDPDVSNRINEILENLAFPDGVKIKVQGILKQNAVFKIEKVPELYSHLMGGTHFVLLVNQELYDKIDGGEDEQALEILADDELNKAGFDLDKGVAKKIDYEFKSFPGSINKFGYDKIARAKELQKHAVSQKEDETEGSGKAVVLKGSKNKNTFFEE